jgi:hypothetical protein
MMQAKKVLDPKHKKLHEDLDIFIKQEVQHCKQHIAFNNSLYAQGYEGMKAIEESYKADYDRFLKEKSLRFNLAYAEGFEAMGSASALVFFEDLGDLLDGADKDAVDLWKWHLAEERCSAARTPCCWPNGRELWKSPAWENVLSFGSPAACTRINANAAQKSIFYFLDMSGRWTSALPA